MKLYQKIALRYLFSKRRLNAISIIAYLSIAGIALGTATLIIVMSIFNGFREITENQMTDCDPHIRILPAEGMYMNYNDSLNAFLQNSKIIESYEANITGKAVAATDNGIRIFNVQSYKKIDSGYYKTIYSKFVIGSSSNPFKNSSIYLGFKIAEELKLQPSDHFTLFSPVLIERSIRTFRPLPKIETNLDGLIYSNVKNIDYEMGFLDYKTAQKLFSLKDGQFSNVDINLISKDAIGTFKTDFFESFSSSQYALTNWQELNSNLLAVMKIERISTFLILGLIILIAVFNILTSITMTVLEKQPDIGLLRALGATRKYIQKIYITEGILIGLFSTLTGLILGLGFCYLQLHFKLFKLDTSQYIIDAIPVVISPTFVIITALFSFILSTLAALYPAIRAGKTEITKALRHE